MQAGTAIGQGKDKDIHVQCIISGIEFNWTYIYFITLMKKDRCHPKCGHEHAKEFKTILSGKKAVQHNYNFTSEELLVWSLEELVFSELELQTRISSDPQVYVMLWN